MTVPLAHFLLVSALLFSIGVFGLFLNRRNVLILIMAVELILLASIINLAAFSAYLGSISGQVFALFVLTAAAAEAAIGLALLVVYHRARGSIEIEKTAMMKG